MSARRYELHRDEDVSGISGTGVVAEGIEFSDGTVVQRWLPTATGRPGVVKPTTVIFGAIADVIGLHGHDGKTRVVWLDGHDDGTIVSLDH